VQWGTAILAVAGGIGLAVGATHLMPIVRNRALDKLRSRFGLRSFLLKPFDPFFRKNGVTVLPIKVTGTRDQPSFGLDFHRKKDEAKSEAGDCIAESPSSGRDRTHKRGGRSRLFFQQWTACYSSTRISFFAQISLSIFGHTVTLTSPR
jgi:hypothetical protein